MGKPSKEYKRILDVMTAHAIHYGDRGVSFVCKKNSGSADISTPAKSSITANIRRLLGNDVARDILEIEHETKIQGDTAIEMKLNGRISNPNYNRKKSKFIVFVNDRLVDCRRIRKAIELVYSSYLPRKTHPFAYISLKIPPHIVDVNVCTSLVSISKSQTHTHTHTHKPQVHPTKRDVHFLYEDEIVGAIETCVREKLTGTNSSRTFMTQTILVKSGVEMKLKRHDSEISTMSTISTTSSLGADEEEHEEEGRSSSINSSSSTSSTTTVTTNNNTSSTSNNMCSALKTTTTKSTSKKKLTRDYEDEEKERRKKRRKKSIDPRKFIRTDAKARTMDRYVTTSLRSFAKSSTSSSPPSSKVVVDADDDEDDDMMDTETTKKSTPPPPSSTTTSTTTTTTTKKRKKRQHREIRLRSVLTLQEEIKKRSHRQLTTLIRNSVFVCAIDRTMCVFQHGLKLYVVQTLPLLECMFYQMTVQRFSNFERIPIEPPLKIKDCIRLALDLPEAKDVVEWQKQEGSTKDEVSESGAELLAEKAAMLQEYFSIEINEHAELCAIPEIVPGHVPCPQGVLQFLLELITEVDFENERPCFADLATCFARYYSVLPSDNGNIKSASSEYKTNPGDTPWGKLLEQVLFPFIQSDLYPPREFSNEGVFVEVACLERLYKIFERC